MLYYKYCKHKVCLLLHILNDIYLIIIIFVCFPSVIYFLELHFFMKFIVKAKIIATPKHLYFLAKSVKRLGKKIEKVYTKNGVAPIDGVFLRPRKLKKPAEYKREYL